MESIEHSPSQLSSKDLIEIFRFLRKYNIKQTELCFHREYHSLTDQTSTNVLDYFTIYSYISDFILKSPYQLELVQILFPLFVHLYLDLLEHNYLIESQEFYNQFIHSTFYHLHAEFFYQLKLISQSSKHLYQCPLTHAFRTSRFFLRLSMTICNDLQNFIDFTKKQLQSHSQCSLTSKQMSLLLSLFQQYLKIDINQQFFTPSNVVRYQTIEQPMTPIFVHINLTNKIQFTRLYTGIFPVTNENQFIRQDVSLTYPQIDIPRLGPHQLPSICLFTIRTHKQIINCIVLSNDCQFLAIGFQSSEILICSVNPTQKLTPMKPVKELRHSKDQILSSNERLLIGHTGPIFTLAFEQTKQFYLLSGSQDCTIRLWDLTLWSCLIVYKMHMQPVINVTFASIGSMFASCSMDGVICLWTIEKIHPIRIYPEYGSSGPVHLIEFHPNSNYLASTHNDHTIHLWNIHHDNSLVRIFNGDRHQITSIRFSPNGHFLISGCSNGEIILWDIQNNLQIAHLVLHKQAISSIEFSPLTGTLLLIASLDSTISLWNCFMITKIYEEKLTDTMNTNSSSSNKILLNLFRTKNIPIVHIRFSKENVLYAMGLTNE